MSTNNLIDTKLFISNMVQLLNSKGQALQLLTLRISLLVIVVLAILTSIGSSKPALASSSLSTCANSSVSTTATIYAGPDTTYAVIQVASPNMPVCPIGYNHDAGIVWVKLTNGGWIQRDLVQNSPGGLSYIAASSTSPVSVQTVHVTVQVSAPSPSTPSPVPTITTVQSSQTVQPSQPVPTVEAVQPAASVNVVSSIPASPSVEPAEPTNNCHRGCVTQPTWCGSPIKGNISYKTGEKIYHVVGGQYYSRTKMSPGKGERWFCTEGEAVAAGWRRSMR